MRLTRIIGIGLLCFVASSYGQDRESQLIRSVRELRVATFDSSHLDRGNNRLERYFGIYARVVVPSIEWRVTDCGERGNGVETPTCVEGRARTAPDITMVVSVRVADRAQQPAAFSLHGFFVTQGNITTSADSLDEFARLAVLTTTRLREPIPASSDGITEIMLERTWCYGACPIDKLLLHEDGSAVYAAKQYTPRRGFFSGTVRRQEFNELAQWLTAQGFFELRGSYGDPNVDTATQVLRVTRGGKQTWVVNNQIRRSLEVLAMERVIGAVAEGIDWQPVKSGIRGAASRRSPGEPWRPIPATFTVYAPDEEYGFVVQADVDGKFELPLLPGSYRIEAMRSYSPSGTTRSLPSQTLIVRAGGFTDVAYRLDVETQSAEFTIGGDDVQEQN